jgi:Ca2+/Na+ antiporter
MVMMVIPVLMLWLAAFTGKRYQLGRGEGLIFLLVYVGYIVWLAVNI